MDQEFLSGMEENWDFCLLAGDFHCKWKENSTVLQGEALLLSNCKYQIKGRGEMIRLKASHDIIRDLLENRLYTQASGLSTLSARSICFGLYDYKRQGNIRVIFNNLLEKEYPPHLQDLYLLEILILLKSCSPIKKGQKRDKWSIQDVIQHVHEHYDEPNSLDEMAEKCGLNSSYLSRIFKEATGESLFSCINRIRIEKACLLLGSSSLSILEIAFTVGYNNITFFNRYFKKVMGLTPGQYRKVRR